jgi:hypothetical protein
MLRKYSNEIFSSCWEQRAVDKREVLILWSGWLPKGTGIEQSTSPIKHRVSCRSRTSTERRFDLTTWNNILKWHIPDMDIP